MASTASSSIGTLATDPLRNFKFQVDITIPGSTTLGGLNMGFMSVSGLNITTEVIPYREGGFNTTTQKMPGQSDFAPITLSKGVIVGNNKMLDWMRMLFTVQQGTGSVSAVSDFRGTMAIRVMQHPCTMGVTPLTEAVFQVYGAWPTAVAFSDLDAGANAIMVEQMTIAHEGFDYALSPTLGTAATITTA